MTDWIRPFPPKIRNFVIILLIMWDIHENIVVHFNTKSCTWTELQKIGESGESPWFLVLWWRRLRQVSFLLRATLTQETNAQGQTDRHELFFVCEGKVSKYPHPPTSSTMASLYYGTQPWNKCTPSPIQKARVRFSLLINKYILGFSTIRLPNNLATLWSLQQGLGTELLGWGYFGKVPLPDCPVLFCQYYVNCPASWTETLISRRFRACLASSKRDESSMKLNLDAYALHFYEYYELWTLMAMNMNMNCPGMNIP